MAEFNKGYYRRQGRKEGAHEERQRIIELLVKTGNSEAHTECYVEDCWCPHSVRLIALIKGENKPFITTKQAEELTNEMLEE